MLIEDSQQVFIPLSTTNKIHWKVVLFIDMRYFYFLNYQTRLFIKAF